MQKLINVIALLSGLTSLAVIGGGTYLYLNKDAMIEDVRAKATEEITKAITEALPGMIDSSIPELPTSTGGVVDSKPAIPGL
jgi:hypothetical protein